MVLKQSFIFAILAALCWGVSPIFAKLGLIKVNPLIGISIRTFVITVTILVVLLVSGSAKELRHVDSKTIILLAVEGLLASFAGHFFYFKAMKFWEASRVTPIVASYPLIAFILAVIFLGERLTLAKGVGAVLVASGVLLLSL